MIDRGDATAPSRHRQHTGFSSQSNRLNPISGETMARSNIRNSGKVKSPPPASRAALEKEHDRRFQQLLKTTRLGVRVAKQFAAVMEAPAVPPSSLRRAVEKTLKDVTGAKPRARRRLLKTEA